MSVNITSTNYDSEFLCNLLKQIDDKISLISDKDYKNNIYDLGLNINLSRYQSLLDLRDIIQRVIDCNACYEEFDIEDIIFVAKNIINKC